MAIDSFRPPQGSRRCSLERPGRLLDGRRPRTSASGSTATSRRAAACPATRSSGGSATASSRVDGARGQARDRGRRRRPHRLRRRRSRATSASCPRAAELAVLHEDAATGGARQAGRAWPSTPAPAARPARSPIACSPAIPEMAGVGGPGRPGIVHRLDQGTSGVLVVARTAAAYQRACPRLRLPRGRQALPGDRLRPARAPAPGTIEAPIGRHPERRKEMAVRRARAGRRAPATAPSRAPPGSRCSSWDLATGRTHQIRVHLKHLGHPAGRRPGLRRGAVEGRCRAGPGAAARLPPPRPPRLAPRLRAPGERRGARASRRRCRRI